MAARDQRLAIDHNDRVHHAFLIASLMRSAKPQRMDKFLRKIDLPQQRQTAEQQIAIAKRWAALGYGKVTEHGSR